MFCGKCGTQNPDAAAFCRNCGTRLNEEANAPVRTPVKTPVKAQPQRRPPAPKRKRRQDKKVGMIAVAAAAVVVLMLAFVLFGGRSYKSTVKQYVKATFDGNAKKIVNLLPDKMIDYALEENGYDRKELDDLIDDLSDELQDYIGILDAFFGDKWKVSYKIVSAEKLKGDDLEDIQKDYKDMRVKVSAARKVELDLTIKFGDSEQSNSMNIYLIKVGRSWYLDAGRMSLF